MFKIVCLFFFFKQKTAYELRISDGSSDVCSSDLENDVVEALAVAEQPAGFGRRKAGELGGFQVGGDAVGALDERGQVFRFARGQAEAQPDRRHQRSEEHTSELQSLMRISYAVFCLKKKKHTKCI